MTFKVGRDSGTNMEKIVIKMMNLLHLAAHRADKRMNQVVAAAATPEFPFEHVGQ